MPKRQNVENLVTLIQEQCDQILDIFKLIEYYERQWIYILLWQTLDINNTMDLLDVSILII